MSNSHFITQKRGAVEDLRQHLHAILESRDTAVIHQQATMAISRLWLLVDVNQTSIPMARIEALVSLLKAYIDQFAVSTSFATTVEAVTKAIEAEISEVYGTLGEKSLLDREQ